MSHNDPPSMKKIGIAWSLILVGSMISIFGIVWSISTVIVIVNWNTSTSHRMRTKGPCIEESLPAGSSGECWHPQHRIYSSIGENNRTVVVCRCEPPTPEMTNWNPRKAEK